MIDSYGTIDILLHARKPSPSRVRTLKTPRAAGSNILGRAFQPNNILVPIARTRGQIVKRMKDKAGVAVDVEDVGVQTEKFV